MCQVITFGQREMCLSQVVSKIYMSESNFYLSQTIRQRFCHPTNLKIISFPLQDQQIDAKELQACLTRSGISGNYQRKHKPMAQFYCLNMMLIILLKTQQHWISFRAAALRLVGRDRDLLKRKEVFMSMPPTKKALKQSEEFYI